MEPEQTSESKYPWYKYKRTRLDARFFAFWQFLSATIIIVATIMLIVDSFFTTSDDYGASSTAEENASTKNCNVEGLILRGDVVTYISPDGYNDNGDVIIDEQSSENIVGRIEKAEKDNSIRAIILEVDSYGGSGVAGEEIADALKNAKKPTVALIRGAGVSAAYWASTGANKIFASKNSDVGGIGVTMSYLDDVKKNQNDGYIYNQLSAGKFKDTGNPDKALSQEEINLLMRDVNIMHNNFIQGVAENRKLDIEKVKNLADGSSMLGEMALANGLIDQIGGEFEAKKYLKEKIGQDVDVCW
ncbi:MAG: S49 family peptidase [bacterium]